MPFTQIIVEHPRVLRRCPIRNRLALARLEHNAIIAAVYKIVENQRVHTGRLDAIRVVDVVRFGDGVGTNLHTDMYHILTIFFKKTHSIQIKKKQLTTADHIFAAQVPNAMECRIRQPNVTHKCIRRVLKSQQTASAICIKQGVHRAVQCATHFRGGCFHLAARKNALHNLEMFFLHK